MPANVQLVKHDWQVEVGWERRRFWMDAAKVAARKNADRMTDVETATPESADPTAGEDEVPVCVKVWFVDFHREGCESVRFRVNRRKDGRFTLSDPRGKDSGTAGTTGLWGTIPPMRAARPRSLTPTAFKVEAARFVGKALAEEITVQLRAAFSGAISAT